MAAGWFHSIISWAVVALQEQPVQGDEPWELLQRVPTFSPVLVLPLPQWLSLSFLWLLSSSLDTCSLSADSGGAEAAMSGSAAAAEGSCHVSTSWATATSMSLSSSCTTSSGGLLDNDPSLCGLFVVIVQVMGGLEAAGGSADAVTGAAACDDGA